MVNVVLRSGQVHTYHDCWINIINAEWPGKKEIEVIDCAYSITQAKYTSESVLAVIEHDMCAGVDGHTLNTGEVLDFSMYS